MLLSCTVTSSKTTPVSESTNGTRTLADRASESESANNDTSSTVPCKVVCVHFPPPSLSLLFHLVSIALNSPLASQV